MVMSKLRVTTREIGSVRVFDLLGDPSQESLQEVAWKIQRSIRRHRLQRVILNLQKIVSLDEISIRKLVAAFIRPQRSVIYGASGSLVHQLEGTYLPHNVHICPTEKEVAEDFGPFLFHKADMGGVFGGEERHSGHTGPGTEMERRRSKRMHVAIPLELTLFPEGKDSMTTRGISTNISQGGIFVEYLDLDAIKTIEKLGVLEGARAEIQIHPSGNFPEEYHLEGTVRREEIRRRGLGIGIQFKETLD